MSTKISTPEPIGRLIPPPSGFTLINDGHHQGQPFIRCHIRINTSSAASAVILTDPIGQET
jgi:hypothetical protein